MTPQPNTLLLADFRALDIAVARETARATLREHINRVKTLSVEVEFKRLDDG